MTEPHLVSIIIPTYNQAGLLRHALCSVINQTHSDWEAIIIDNHSDDDTISVVESFDESRFRLAQFRNNGVIAASRNEGIRMARGKWIAFLDSDDLWRPEKLRVCLEKAEDNTDLIGHREATFCGDVELSVSPYYSLADATYRRLLFNHTCFSPSAALVKKSLIDGIGGFSEEPSLTTVEDYDLWLRLVEVGAVVQFVGQVLSDYRLHEGNASGSILRHMNAGLQAVELHFKRLRHKRAGDELRLHRRRSMIIYGAARNFQKAASWPEARKYFTRSLLNYPFNFRALAGLLATFLSFRQT